MCLPKCLLEIFCPLYFYLPSFFQVLSIEGESAFIPSVRTIMALVDQFPFYFTISNCLMSEEALLRVQGKSLGSDKGWCVRTAPYNYSHNSGSYHNESKSVLVVNILSMWGHVPMSTQDLKCTILCNHLKSL